MEVLVRTLPEMEQFLDALTAAYRSAAERRCGTASDARQELQDLGQRLTMASEDRRRLGIAMDALDELEAAAAAAADYRAKVRAELPPLVIHVGGGGGDDPTA